MNLSEIQSGVLRELAHKYIWWKSPEDALRYPQRVLAQVMNLGEWDDVVLMQSHFDGEILRDVLRRAEAGQLDARSWHFWHYRLQLAETPADIPPMPKRKTE